ncbi:hypothetical protein [Hymenobacter psychrotolerans]|uniref:Uncharacterized protein n=1 Tax=Hymenobacter psychrotolerans DSM 18569 TaxID=1121959 RepID=A0A1M7EVY4_9BACT|nr:hypothetical protein [Hymenobacter psychrotolerans]SHL95934.1 hypothetical protein SAMN02746009_03695 [Hymenobacter psychrotolerans DSM 18569]
MRFPFVYILCVGLALVSSGCKKVCDTDDIPQYSLTPGLRAWTAPYPKDAVLRFRNATTGYVRSYRVTEAENKMDGVGAGVNPCPTYNQEFTSHILQRTDSTGNSENKSMQLYTVVAGNTTRVQSRFNIGNTSVSLPLKEVEDGTQSLSPATFAGRTYPAVLGGTTSLAGSGSRVVVTLYMTKAEGLIRFEERGGTVWDRQ